jgi:hypothetical protein
MAQELMRPKEKLSNQFKCRRRKWNAQRTLVTVAGYPQAKCKFAGDWNRTDSNYLGKMRASNISCRSISITATHCPF